MSDVSGIPNMGFGGGGGYFGGNASLGLPAMSADQINASMGWNPNAAQFDPWANTGGFGASDRLLFRARCRLWPRDRRI